MKQIVSFLLLLALISSSALAENVVLMPFEVKYASGDSLVGEYTGETADGIPEGYGLFSSSNAEGTPWHYIGQWQNGKMHGNGLTVWETGAQEKGVYSNGYYLKGTEIKEYKEIKFDFLDLPYDMAAEKDAKEELLPHMVYVKTTHNYGHANIYVNIDQFASRRKAIHDSCIYMLNVSRRLCRHTDIQYIKIYFTGIADGNKERTYMNLCWDAASANGADYDAMIDLVDQSALSFMKQLYYYSIKAPYKEELY